MSVLGEGSITTTILFCWCYGPIGIRLLELHVRFHWSCFLREGGVRVPSPKTRGETLVRPVGQRLVGALVLAIFLMIGLQSSAWGQANVTGQWKTLPTQMPINPIHIALMHTGKVLIVSGSGNLPSDTNFMAAIWDPASDTVTTMPVSWDMFCNGMTVLPDGRPLILGGTLQYDPFHGEQRISSSIL